MKQVLKAVLLLVVLSAVGFAQSADKESSDDRKAKQQVLELNRSWAEAITKADATKLDQLFADDMVVTSGGGQIRDKAGEIKDAAGAPDPDFAWINPFTTEDVRVRIYDDAAVVTGLAKWAFRYKAAEAYQERRYTHVYVKQRGQWRIVAQQVSSNLFRKP